MTLYRKSIQEPTILNFVVDTPDKKLYEGRYIAGLENNSNGAKKVTNEPQVTMYLLASNSGEARWIFDNFLTKIAEKTEEGARIIESSLKEITADIII